jgi:hypothetical protein
MGVKFDVSGVLRTSARLRALPSEFEKARVRSVTKLQRALIPEATRDIGAEFALRAARIRKGLSVHRTNSYVDLVGDDAGIGLAQGYQGRQTKTGIVVTLRRADGPTRFRHAFIQEPGGRAKSTGPQAFEREGRGAPRMPIDRLFSQNIAGMLRDPERAGRLAAFGMRILDAEMKRILGTR